MANERGVILMSTRSAVTVGGSGQKVGCYTGDTGSDSMCSGEAGMTAETDGQ